LNVKILTRDQVRSIGWNGDASIIDLKSNVKYTVRGSVGDYYHTDFMPKTRNDAEAMLRNAGGKWSWGARPVVLQLSNNTATAAAIHTYPHSVVVASNAFNIAASDLKNAGVSGNNAGWAIGSHMCLHYIDSLKLRPLGVNNFYTSMNNAVVTAGRMAGSADLSKVATILGGGGSGGGSGGGGGFGDDEFGFGPSRPQPADPPVVIRDGRFILNMEYNSATQFYNKYKLSCPAESVPFVVLPASFTLNGKKASELIGYCALVVNTDTNNAQASIIGNIGGTGQIDTVSVRAGWGVGADPRYPSQVSTPNIVGNFKIAIFDDFTPEWSAETSLINQIESECSRRLAASLVELNQNARAMELSGGTMSPESIDPTMIEKYMLTVDRNTTSSFSYSRAKDLGVVGMMIEAGSITSYSSSKGNRSFINPKLEEQIRAADDNKLDYAFFMDARARNKMEVQQEMHLLSYVTNKWPPILGMWLKIQLTQSKNVNDDIIDEYYTQLVKLGFIGNVGLYCGRNQLQQIDWKSHSKHWYWLMVDTVSNVGVLDELLTPEFFMLDPNAPEDASADSSANSGLGRFAAGAVGLLVAGIPGAIAGVAIYDAVTSR